MEATAPGRALPSVMTAVRHHVPALLGIVMICLGLAVGFVMTTTPLYTSTAALLLSPAPGNPLTVEETASTTRVTVAMETEGGLLTTPTLVDLTGKVVGRAIPAEKERVHTSSPSGSQILEITFTSTSPEQAQQGAQAFADTYLEYREGRAVANQEARIERLETQATAAQDALTNALDGAADDQFSAQEVEIYTTRLADINANISAARVESTDPGRVVTPAATPTSPAGTNPFLILLAGGIGGVLLGTLIALLLEWRRDLVRENEELDVSGVSVFARLPQRTPPGLVVGTEHSSARSSAAHEAYRRLRAGVVANGPRPHVLGVTAVGVHEHTSAVVANLAISLAEARYSVLVIAADPGSHGVETLFEISDAPGLAEVLWGTVEPREAMRQRAGVSILPGGDVLAARELLGGQGFRDTVARLSSDFDYVIIAASSTGTADGDAAIASTDSVLLSVTSSRTTHAQVSAALDRFQRLGIRPLGAVSVPPTPGGTSRHAAHGGVGATAVDSPAGADTPDDSMRRASNADA
ncbi:hypothetical protein NF556_01945 [Ornithinimicrobium faecis]|uniref:Capsular polysaccharide biosynthesis protein n=1 Tax=Ornithinimicrobium faecis TaxID=2934158 RepID=A0ABY4YV08_9MICO|nr:hypothetical protein [Ornithinimicrobium sp. HY1793]USQ80451.1 hypothetical protein NF556_01945 [Ornithinimicrobium sp. HY1793]